MDQWESTKAEVVWELEITATGDGDVGGRVEGYGRVCSKDVEYGRTIHCDTANSGPMQGDDADARDVGNQKMVGIGGPGHRRSKDGGIVKG